MINWSLMLQDFIIIIKCRDGERGLIFKQSQVKLDGDFFRTITYNPSYYKEPYCSVETKFLKILKQIQDERALNPYNKQKVGFIRMVMNMT